MRDWLWRNSHERLPVANVQAGVIQPSIGGCGAAGERVLWAWGS
jgi:hypothetical protein